MTGQFCADADISTESDVQGLFSSVGNITCLSQIAGKVLQ